MSLLVSIQLNSLNPAMKMANIFWVTEAVIDSARLLGLPTYRNKVSIAVFNPELNLRDAIKEDKPISRRLQFIQNYLNKTIASTR